MFATAPNCSIPVNDALTQYKNRAISENFTPLSPNIFDCFIKKVFAGQLINKKRKLADSLYRKSKLLTPLLNDALHALPT